jgi:hypothetical protein
MVLSGLLLLTGVGFPSAAFAQPCSGEQYAGSLYVDGYYDPATWEKEIYAEGDDPQASCCYHSYSIDIVIVSEVATEYHNEPGGSTTFRSGITLKENHVTVTYLIGCPCIGQVVGGAQLEDDWYIPEPSVTLDPPSAESDIAYPDIAITATVNPPEFTSAFSWDGHGTTNPENSMQRLVSTATAGLQTVRANINGVQLNQAPVNVRAPRLRISPPSVVRGQCATLIIDNPPNPEGAQVLYDWRYEVTEQDPVVRSTAMGNATCAAGGNGQTSWAGTFVASGKARITITRAGQAVPVQQSPLDVTVDPRAGWNWVVPPAIQRDNGFMVPGWGNTMMVAETPNRPPPSYVAGRASAGVAYNESVVEFEPITDNGPNHDFKYLTHPLPTTDAEGRATRYDWIIMPDIDNLLSPFALRQYGSFNPTTNPFGCIWRGTLRANVRLHESGEGALAVEESHYTAWKAAFEANNPGLIVESAVGGPQATAAALRTTTLALLESAKTAISAAVIIEPTTPPTNDPHEPLIFLGRINYPDPYDSDCMP